MTFEVVVLSLSRDLRDSLHSTHSLPCPFQPRRLASSSNPHPTNRGQGQFTAHSLHPIGAKHVKSSHCNNHSPPKAGPLPCQAVRRRPRRRCTSVPLLRAREAKPLSAHIHCMHKIASTTNERARRSQTSPTRSCFGRPLSHPSPFPLTHTLPLRSCCWRRKISQIKYRRLELPPHPVLLSLVAVNLAHNILILLSLSEHATALSCSCVSGHPGRCSFHSFTLPQSSNRCPNQPLCRLLCTLSALHQLPLIVLLGLHFSLRPSPLRLTSLRLLDQAPTCHISSPPVCVCSCSSWSEPNGTGAPAHSGNPSLA
jgi:hypothetical protein